MNNKVTSGKSQSQQNTYKEPTILIIDTKHTKTSLQPFKGATKLYFIHYLHVVIILFSTGLCKSALSTYSFGKTRFSSFCVLLLAFRASISLALNF